MAWPPVIPPATRTDNTDMVTVHASDHNQLATALSTLITSGSITSPFRTNTAFVLVPGTNGVNRLLWYRIGQRVFIDYCWNSGASAWNIGTPADEVRLTIPFPISASYPTQAAATPRVGGVQIEAVTINSVWGTLDLANNNRFIYISGSAAAVINAGQLNKANGLISGVASYLTDA